MTYVATWGGNTAGEGLTGTRSGGPLREPELAAAVPSDVTKLARGYFDGACLSPSKGLLIGGANELGECADETRIEHTNGPVKAHVDQVVDFAFGGAGGLAIHGPERKVAVWGGGMGTLELSTNPVHSLDKPTDIPNLQGATGVYASGGMRFYRDAFGAYFGFGENQDKQLGLGFNSDVVRKPTKLILPSMPDIAYLVPGSDSTTGGHLIAVYKDGHGLILGGNGQEQCGLPPTKDGIGQPQTIPFKGIRAAAASVSHSIVVDEHGDAYVAGSNNYGERGMGDTALYKGWTKVPLPGPCTGCAAGLRTSYFIVGGVVYVCGWAQHGLGIPTEEDVVSSPEPIEGLKGVTALYAGEFGTFAVTPIQPPSPVLLVLDGKTAITPKWRYAPVPTSPWKLAIRPHQGGAGNWTPVKAKGLPPATREATITTLGDGGPPLTVGQLYDVKVSNHGFKTRFGSAEVTG